MATNLRNIKYFFISILSTLSFTSTVNAQFDVDTSLTNQEYINNLVGLGVSFGNVQFQGDGQAIGYFSGASNNLGFSNGIILSTGLATAADVNDFGFGFLENGLTNIPELAGFVNNCFTPGATNDGLILQFDFVPQSTPVSFRYIFASSEYPTYVCSEYNDAFAFLISGPGIVGEQNLAVVPGTGDPITISTINSGNIGSAGDISSDPCILTNSNYFNPNGPADLSYGGYTNVMTAVADVTACETYTLRLIIADGCDSALDSAVFLEANSFGAAPISISQTTLNGDSVTYEGCAPATLIFSRQDPEPFDYIFPFTLTGTAVNGVDYEQVPGSVTIPAGQTTVTLDIVGITDGITEGIETVELNYETVCGTISTLIYITEPPALIVSSDPAPSLCGGQGPVTVSGSASGGVPGYTYSWSDALGTATSADVNPFVTTTYVLTATDFCGTEATANITVPVGTTPDVPVLNLPVDPICEDETINLSASTATAGAELFWTGPNGFTANAVNSIQIPNATVLNDGVYQVYAGLTGCNSEPASVTMTVKPRPSVPVINTNSPVCEGLPINLTAVVAPANSIVSWTGPNNFSTNGAVVTIASASLADAGIFAATATLNGCDANASGSAQVVVNDTPDAPVILANSPVCAGFDLDLSTTANADSYLWSGPQSWTSTQQNPTRPAMLLANSGSYSLEVTVNGCTSPATPINVQVIDASFLPPVTTNSPVCEGSNLTFSTPQVNGAQYFWNGPDAFSSNNAQGEIANTAELNEGDYSVYLVIGACTTATSTSSILINPIPVADAGLDIQVCSLQDGQLGAPPVPGYSYAWFPSDSLNFSSISNPTVSVGNIGGQTDELTYILTVTAGGCSNTDDVIVEVLPQPVASFVAPNSQCFEGHSFDFYADGIWESIDPRFVWDFGPWGVPDSSALRGPTDVTFSSTGLQLVRLVVIDQGCASNTFIAPVMVDKMPVSNFVANTITACEPALIQFENLSENQGDLMDYQWSFGNGTSSTTTHPKVLYSSAGNYEVELIVNGVNGCTTGYSIPNMITINKTPLARFEAKPVYTTIVDPEIALNDLSLFADECSYSMGNGDTIFSFNHVYTYPDTGTYNVTQILSNSKGCTDTTSIEVRVDLGFKVYIPAAFTPNEDGLNDLFKVYGEEFTDFSMQVFNRWGQLLYQSFDADNGWDGKTRLSDEKVAGGVYIYTIELKDKFGLPYTYRGEVTVLR
ncbi:MAG: choice-of-anchor L domain-containing protein [Bacteroidia bacterium]